MTASNDFVEMLVSTKSTSRVRAFRARRRQGMRIMLARIAEAEIDALAGEPTSTRPSGMTRRQ